MNSSPTVPTEDLSRSRWTEDLVLPWAIAFVVCCSPRFPVLPSLSVKIDGVQHEFSTIPGVKEDVTEIILNIKGLTAKLFTEEPKTVRIEAEGRLRSDSGQHRD